MEIERKFLIHKSLLPDLSTYPKKEIAQGYLCTDPVLRIRKSNDSYFFTYKGKGFLEREEFERPISCEAFQQLLPKIEGNLISKTRYCIPYQNLTLELDVFHQKLEGLYLAEIEFTSKEEANDFDPSSIPWLAKDVTTNKTFANSQLRCLSYSSISENDSFHNCF